MYTIMFNKKKFLDIRYDGLSDRLITFNAHIYFMSEIVILYCCVRAHHVGGISTLISTNRNNIDGNRMT